MREEPLKTVTVGQPAVIHERGRTTVSATVGVGNERHDLWYRLPQAAAPEDASAFLAAALLPAMQEGDRLEVAGEVSPRLLGAASTIQDIYHAWNPHWRRIPISARAVEAGPPRSERGGAGFFTGGVDSFYTVLKRRDAIAALIFVHGFDVPLTNQALRQTVSTAMRRAASGLQRPLLEVETNLRDFSDRYVSWEYYHGAALASVALLLSPQWSHVYVASTRSYATLIPWGSHPLLDPLWSTEHTEIVHDGCEAARVDKVAALAGCDLALTTLRVCWETPTGVYNCGRCEKCLRTMIDLRIAGALDRCPTFARPLDLGAVSRMAVDRKAGYLEQSLRAIERRGTDPALAKALRAALAGRRRVRWSFGRAGRRLRGVLGSCKRLALPMISRIGGTRGAR